MKNLLAHTIRSGLLRGAAQVEAFGSASDTLHVLIEGREVKRIEQRSDVGLSVRVVLQRRGGTSLGSAYTMQLSKPELERKVRQAISIAKTKTPDPKRISFPPNAKGLRQKILFDESVPEVDANYVTRLAAGMVRAALRKKYASTISGDLLLTKYSVWLSNSQGFNGHYRGTVFATHAWVTAKKGGSVGSGFDDYAGRTFDEEAPERVARSAADTAVSLLNPKSIPKGKVDAVIGPDGVHAILANTFTLGVNAEFVQKKQSPFADRLGQYVGSRRLNILDDSSDSYLIGSRPYDDEGARVGRRFIIKDGVLTGYLHNLRTAVQEGISSTGNGIRLAAIDLSRKYAGEPSVAPNNLIVEQGKKDADELISEVGNGIYAKAFIGAHTANRITGEFSVVPSMAYRIKNGSIEHPIKEAVIAGNILDFLKNINAVADDSKQMQSASGDSTVYSPSMLVSGLSLAA